MIGCPSQLPINAVYVVYDWGTQYSGWTFKQSPSGFVNRNRYNGGSLDMTQGMSVNDMIIPVPIDPITAIHLGLVTPEEISLPPGIAAAFNMLK